MDYPPGITFLYQDKLEKVCHIICKQLEQGKFKIDKKFVIYITALGKIRKEPIDSVKIPENELKTIKRKIQKNQLNKEKDCSCLIAYCNKYYILNLDITKQFGKTVYISRPKLNCAVCGKSCTLLCICKLKKYCSHECQKLDWEEHKNICQQIRENFKERPNQECGSSNRYKGLVCGDVEVDMKPFGF